MTPRSWNAKDERQYTKIKRSQKQRGRSKARAEEIAARTVNKRRRQEGRTAQKTSQGTGNPNAPLEERTRRELYNLAAARHIAGRSKLDKAGLVRALRRRDS